MMKKFAGKWKIILFILVSAFVMVNIKTTYSVSWKGTEDTECDPKLRRKCPHKIHEYGNDQRRSSLKNYHRHFESMKRGILKRFKNLFARGNTGSDEIDQIRAQIQRRKILDKGCKEVGIDKRPSSLDLTLVPSHLLVDDVHKFMFCQIRKVSSISWRRLLNDVINRDSSDTMKLRRLSSYSLQEQRERLENYNTFVFVREPLMRFLSAWQDKFVNGFDKQMYERSLGEKIVELVRKNLDPNEKDYLNITFAEFVEYITTTVSTKKMKLTDMHWQSYNARCMPCTVRYDYIGHFENISREAYWILNQIGVGGVSWPVRVPATSLKFARTQFQTLTESQRDALYNLYKTDYKLFGYSVGNLWKELDIP